MNTQDFNLGSYPYTNSQTCLGALFEIDLGSSQYGVPQWIVGDSFLKNVFSVFDGSGRVGFAALKGSEAQVVSVTAGAVSSQSAQATSSASGSAMTSLGGGGGGLPSAGSSYNPQATGTGIFGGGNLPTPSASEVLLLPLLRSQVARAVATPTTVTAVAAVVVALRVPTRSCQAQWSPSRPPALQLCFAGAFLVL